MSAEMLDAVWAAQFGAGPLGECLRSFDESSGIVTLAAELGSFEMSTIRLHIGDLWRIGVTGAAGRRTRPKSSLSEQISSPELVALRFSMFNDGSGGSRRIGSLRTAPLTPLDTIMRSMNNQRWIPEDGVLVPCQTIPVLARRIILLEWCRRMIEAHRIVAKELIDSQAMTVIDSMGLRSEVENWILLLDVQHGDVAEAIAALSDPTLEDATKPVAPRYRRRTALPDVSESLLRYLLDVRGVPAFTHSPARAANKISSERWGSERSRKGLADTVKAVSGLRRVVFGKSVVVGANGTASFAPTNLSGWAIADGESRSQIETEMLDFAVKTIEMINSRRRTRNDHRG